MMTDLKSLKSLKLYQILMSLSAFFIIIFMMTLNEPRIHGSPNSVKLPDMKNTPSRSNIAILTIVKSNSDRARYKTAMDSMECYALQNNYTYLQLYGENFKTICEQNHIHFQRHCIVAHILKIHHYRWVLLLDADVGVVNEKRRLEEYIKEEANIILYDRFLSFQVAAGSYFAKKSNFSVVFLRGWADYSFRLPKSYRTKDNDAIHMWLVELIAPNAPLAPVCWLLWRRARDITSIQHFTVCCREAIKDAASPQILIYKRVGFFI
ncbi:unnamed protein product [Cylicocyclus nassatus]|uniref:Uncharacterized protein n=1 Tax=Cylicocyclus nassatus TaxID=53992 RepID=A0AA36H9S8_CYLNA|nr:unnamed protein product [Cylicocyclus nassatus]